MCETTRGQSGHDLLMPFRVMFPKDKKCTDRFTASLKAISLFLFLSSISFVLYSSFLRHHDLWFRCPECPDPTIRPRGDNPTHQYNSNSTTNISHIVFGIGGSARTWKDRKHYSQLWWKPNITRGFVWLDEEPEPNTTWSDASPPYRISSDWKKFKFTSSQSAVRISRVVVDSFRVGLPNARWFVMGDDDTVFFTENLVTVLGKYDYRQMYYIGGSSESVEQNVMHAYDMAFGGGGFAISYPLAAELVRIMDECLNRYFNFYGSDQRVWACVGELGVSLTRESGFHQIDIREDPFGLLAAHPMAPLVSLHHLDDVQPLFPNQSQLESLRTLTTAYKVDPARTMQQCFCYYHNYKWSISVSWAYAVQIYPWLLSAKDLETPLQTFRTWRSWSNGPFTFNTRPMSSEPCEQPVIFYLDSIKEDKKGKTVTTYKKSPVKQEKCNQLNYARAFAIDKIVVSSLKMDPHMWEKVPRRQCCEASKGFWSNTMTVKIRNCKHRETITM
ncbi:uncharacterized protein LOC132606127 isoform X1 [Lycium barbarum]|uniref:uncharacterized protein LOC132606127 isoform X1 n=2 Tax=Lycium barbarum TaxID=112863 RepID=UPI00293E3C08|nr:uncharacterized protein LOC132606127 isoform X1 [Lycium barbarum]